MTTTIGRWILDWDDSWRTTDDRVHFTQSKAYGADRWLMRATGVDAQLIANAGMPRRSSADRGLRQMVTDVAAIIGCSNRLVREHHYDLYFDTRFLGWQVLRLGRRWYLQDSQFGIAHACLRPRIDENLWNQLINEGLGTRQGVLDTIETVIEDIEASQTMPWHSWPAGSLPTAGVYQTRFKKECPHR